jgi:hypothetical protein
MESTLFVEALEEAAPAQVLVLQARVNETPSL